MAAFAAMLVATPLLPSDTFSIATEGQNAAPAMLWIMLAICATIAWLLAAFRSPLTLLKWNTTDLVLGAFFVWVAIAGVTASVDANRRAGWNMTASWVSLGLTYYLARLLLRTGTHVRAIIVGILAVTLMFALEGLHESWVTIPQNQARFKRNPAAVLVEAGIAAEPGSAAYDRFKSRLETQGPSGTFALENSLAGFLLPAAIVFLGLLFAGNINLSDKGKSLRTIGLLIGFSLLAICIRYTHSTAAMVSIGVSLLVGAIVFLFRDQRFTSRIMRFGALVFLVLIFAWPFVIAVAGDSVANRLPLTLKFRAEYWQSCLAMLKQNSLWGCGPGNFQDAYPKYMLPQAAETIADPHNLLWEILCNSGVLGGLLFTGALLIAARAPLSRLLFLTVHEEETKIADLAMPISLRATAVGGVAGISLALLLALSSGSNSLVLFLRTWLLFGAIPGGLLVATMLPWIRRGELSSSLVWLAWLGLAIHLTVSGGVGNPGTGSLFFLMLAITQNMAAKGSEFGTSIGRLAGVGALVVLCVAGVAHYQWGYVPVLAARASIGRSEIALADSKTSEAKEALRAAAKADRWDAPPLAKETQLEMLSYFEATAESRVNPEKIISTAKEAIHRSPRSPGLYFELALNLLRANAAEPKAALLAESQALLNKVTELAPSNGVAWAYRAYADSLAKDTNSARDCAKEAIRLDLINPHYDLSVEPSPISGRSFAGWLREVAGSSK